ncbi:MAG: SUMF1/EgtB/PvdO family nonheme iron enzyme [Verrucomicrobiales bacterium]
MNRTLLLLPATLCLLAAALCPAATYEVTSLSSGGEAGTLRWAIAQANADQLDDGNPHRIAFQAGLEGTIEVSEIEVTRDMILAGPGADKLTLSAAGNRRAIFVNRVDRFAAEGLRFTRSVAPASGGGIYGIAGEVVVRYCVFDGCVAARGGAIEMAANALLVSESAFLNCRSESHGGAIWNDSGDTGQGTSVANGTFYRCNAPQRGGAVWARGSVVDLSQSTFQEVTASLGIAAYAEAPTSPVAAPIASLVNCAVHRPSAYVEALAADASVLTSESGNVVARKLRLRAPAWYGAPAAAGAMPVPYCLPDLDSPVIDAGGPLNGLNLNRLDMDVRGSSRAGNPDAGAVEVRSLPAGGTLGLIDAINASNAAGADPVDYIALGSDATLDTALPPIARSVIVIGQSSTGDLIRVDGAGQFRPFTVEPGAVVGFENLRLTNGFSAGGGAILNSGTARVRRCWLVSNRANCGGAIRSVAGSRLEVLDSTFSQNQAEADSGAVEIFGGSADIENCSFYRNEANRGGALGFFSATDAAVRHCSFDQNSAVQEGGAIRVAADSAIALSGSAFTPHAPANIQNYGAIDAAENVDAGPGDPAFDFVSQAWLPFPALYPEQDSPFVNATFFALPRDQTGRLRFDHRADAGAVEWVAAHPYLALLSVFSDTDFDPSDCLPTAGSDIDPHGDLDGDGQGNYFELYFRGDPYDPQRQASVEFFLEPQGGFRFPAFRFQIDERLSDQIRFAMWRSVDLAPGGWSRRAASYTATFTYHQNVVARDQNAPVTAGGRGFYRLGIDDSDMPAVFPCLEPVDAVGNVADGGGFGSVAYRYRMGTYEVTNEQYVRFLNAVDFSGTNDLNLYDARMGTETWGGIAFDPAAATGKHYRSRDGRARFPVNYIDYFCALRFCNWLHNGAPAYVIASHRPVVIESGAYTLTGVIPSDPDAIARESGARYFLPSLDEWIRRTTSHRHRWSSAGSATTTIRSAPTP